MGAFSGSDGDRLDRQNGGGDSAGATHASRAEQVFTDLILCSELADGMADALEAMEGVQLSEKARQQLLHQTRRMVREEMFGRLVADGEDQLRERGREFMRARQGVGGYELRNGLRGLARVAGPVRVVELNEGELDLIGDRMGYELLRDEQEQREAAERAAADRAAVMEAERLQREQQEAHEAARAEAQRKLDRMLERARDMHALHGSDFNLEETETRIREIYGRTIDPDR